MHRTALAIVMLALAPAIVHGQIGVTAGYNRDSFSGFASDDFRLTESNGINMAIFLDFELGQFGIRPSLAYRQLRDAILIAPDDDPETLEMVEIPVDFRVTAPLPFIKPYLLAGVAVIFPSSSNALADESLAGARIGLGFGFGAEWDIGFRLWPEIRYGTSIGGIVENDSPGASRLDTFIARIGISF